MVWFYTKYWSELSLKSGPSCLQKLVRVVHKVVRVVLKVVRVVLVRVVSGPSCPVSISGLRCNGRRSFIAPIIYKWFSMAFIKIGGLIQVKCSCGGYKKGLIVIKDFNSIRNLFWVYIITMDSHERYRKFSPGI